MPTVEYVETARRELISAVREACFGAADCRLVTVCRHVECNPTRFPLLMQLPHAEIGDLAKEFELITRRRGDELYVGAPP